MPELRRIGFNPEDRFMMAIGHTLAVATQAGNVFGADIANRDLQPVFQFSGAKIGFNPQDRFMMAMGNTLVVVTQDGSVFGADVVGRDVHPVFQFSGAKIGFNPQDRFMMAMGNTLVVITQDGSVFGAEVEGRHVHPVVQFGGAKIGFNPQDRFMVAMGNTLVVITQDGSVFGADVAPSRFQVELNRRGRDVRPVFQFTGAKIGFNPQDRFMVALGNTLVVITQDGSVFGAEVEGRHVHPVFQINHDPVLPESVTLESGHIHSGLSIGGHAKLVIRRDGNCTFTGHMHNSGALPIDFLLTFVAMSPSADAVTVQHRGHTAGHLTPGSEDDDWVKQSFHAEIPQKWEEITKAGLTWTLHANDTLTGQLAEALKDALQKALEAAAQQAVKSLITLV
jgi:hypothetical protein